jgi:trimeric autotransporter adhesin
MADFSWPPGGGGGGDGTVTSVSLTAPSFLSVTGSPVVSSGTLALGLSGTALPSTSGGTGLTSPGASGNVLTSTGSAWVSSPSAGGGFSYLSSDTSVYGGTNSTLTFTGADNTVIAPQAGAALTSGTDNTFLGFEAGSITTTGIQNTCIGSKSGTGLATGTSNTTSVGYGEGAYATGAIAVGSGNSAGGAGSVLVGWNSYDSNQNNNIIIGSAQSTFQGCCVFGTSNGGTGSVATTAAQQICFGTASAPLTDLWIGKGAVGWTAPEGVTIQPTPGAAGTSNLTGGNLTILAGNGTGSGGSGNIIFKTAPASGSGTAANTYTTVGQVDLNGAWTLGATSTTPTHILNSLTATGSGTSTLGTANSPGASTPAGWLSLTINGTTHYIPFF